MSVGIERGAFLEWRASAVRLESRRIGPRALTRLLQLSSPALPVGAFAYSQGLESAVALGWIADESSASAWLVGTLHHGIARLDVPVLARLHRAVAAEDSVAFSRWCDLLLASRESRERREEDVEMARALGRLLTDQGVARCEGEDLPFAAAFAQGAVAFDIPLDESLIGFTFSWAEGQVGALCRLGELGQLAAQRVLATVGEVIPSAVSRAKSLPDAEIGACLPGLALGAALHETQYSRLFKS